MVYVDTSAILKLYIKEKYSLEISEWLIKNNEPILLTNFHELEFINAINLKHYRGEITRNTIRRIISKFTDHENSGIFFRPALNWTEIYKNAIDLSEKYTEKIGSRSLDILHVAMALSIKAKRFLTFDERQSKLASMAGIKIEDLLKP